MLKNLLYLVSIIFIASSSLQGCSPSNDAPSSKYDTTPAVAKVGKQTITEQTLKLELTALPGGNVRVTRPGGHRAELDRLIELMVAEQEGIIRKIDENPHYQQRLAQIKTKARREERELMYEMLYQQLSESNVITDDQIKAYYEKHKNRFLTTRIHLRRITTKSKDELEAAEKQLNEGELFEKVASIFNMDEKLRESGGDMGALLRNDLPNNLRVAAFRLQTENQISPPFESKSSWNLLQLIKKESGVIRPLEDVKGQLVRELKRTQAKQTLLQVIKKRREQMGVTIYEDEVAKLGRPLIPAGARPTKAANPLIVPKSYPASSKALQAKQVQPADTNRNITGH